MNFYEYVERSIFLGASGQYARYAAGAGGASCAMDLKNRLPSRWRYALWIPVLVALLVPALPLLPSWMQWRVVTPPTKASDSTLARSASTLVSVLPSQNVALEETPVGELPKRTISVGTIEVQSITQPLSWRAWITITWSIGAMAAGLRFGIVSDDAASHQTPRAFPADAELRARIEQIAVAVGLRRVPRVVKSSARGLVRQFADCGDRRCC